MGMLFVMWDYGRDRLVSSPSRHYFFLTDASCRSDNTKERHLLFVGCSSAFRIWDFTDLEAIQEILKVDATRKTQEKSLVSGT